MKWLILVLLSGSHAVAGPGQGPDTTYRVELNMTLSPAASFFRNARYPNAPNDWKEGYSVTVRAMWHPGRLLGVGIMSGFVFLSQDELPPNTFTPGEEIGYAKTRLTAIPLQIAASMQGTEVEFGIGVGPYIVQTWIWSGIEASARRFELAVTMFGSYRFTLSEDWHIAPELRLLYLGNRGILSIMPSVNVRFDFLRY